MQPIPHNRLTFGPEEELAVTRVVRSGRWAGGNVLAELESRVALAAGVAEAVGVGSGVAALRLSLVALRIGPGDAVAVPAYSCVALANAVLACGAEPVPVEVEPHTWNMSVDSLRQARVRRSDLKAVIAVHTFGAVAPVRELAALGLPVVEDCSHAFGRGALGALGRLAVFSLYATKLVGAGEGGMILTDDRDLAAWLREARDYSDRAPAHWRLNDKLTDLTAALALCQLDRLPHTLAQRDALAARYTAALAEVLGPGASLPVPQPGRVWYRYAVAVPGSAAVIARLSEQGVTAAQPVDSWAAVVPPISAEAFRRLVSLPLYPTLTPDEQDRVIAALAASVTPLAA